MGRSPEIGGRTIAVLGSLIANLLMPQMTQANDSSPLCSNRQMTTEVALSTLEYFVAICSRGYEDPTKGCYVPTEYYYVGQSRKTPESLTIAKGMIEVSDVDQWSSCKSDETENDETEKKILPWGRCRKPEEV